MSFMFAGALSFNGDISQFQTGRVSRMTGMFQDAASFNGNISNWVRTCCLCQNCFCIRPDLTMRISFQFEYSSKQDLFNVYDFKSMFTNAASFNGNLSAWVSTWENKVLHAYFCLVFLNASH